MLIFFFKKNVNAIHFKALRNEIFMKNKNYYLTFGLHFRSKNQMLFNYEKQYIYTQYFHR